MLIREMLDEEVEDIILTEYEKFGNSVFACLSVTDFKKKVLVASDGGFKGFAIVYWNSEEFYIGRIFAESGEVEKRLLEKCICEATKLNFERVNVEVPVDHDLTKFLAFGFVVDGITRHRYGIGKHAFRLFYEI